MGERDGLLSSKSTITSEIPPHATAEIGYCGTLLILWDQMFEPKDLMPRSSV